MMNPTLQSLAIERHELSACLVAAGREAVITLAERLAAGLTISPLQPAEAGLALMQWRDAVMYHPFFLGEVPLAHAAVVLLGPSGERAEGGAIVMADDAELAHALAVLDAIHSQRWSGVELVEALAQRGAQARAEARRRRQAMLLRTRVDFALLADADANARAEA